MIKESGGSDCPEGVALKEFESTFSTEPPEDARRYLIRAFVACEAMPGDAGAEKHLLRDALCKLRDEWQEDVHAVS